MITSQATPFLSEIEGGSALSAGTRAYFQERLRNKLYHFIVSKFLERERTHGLTKAELARRIGRKPEVVSRLLGAPGNWTLDTVSDLLLGIAGEELEPASLPILDRPKRNYDGPEWLRSIATSKLIHTQQTQANEQNPLHTFVAWPGKQSTQPESEPSAEPQRFRTLADQLRR